MQLRQTLSEVWYDHGPNVIEIDVCKGLCYSKRQLYLFCKLSLASAPFESKKLIGCSSLHPC